MYYLFLTRDTHNGLFLDNVGSLGTHKKIMHTPKQKSNDGLGPLHNVFLLAISVQLSRIFFII